jgi:hypothetical protein
MASDGGTAMCRRSGRRAAGRRDARWQGSSDTRERCCGGSRGQARPTDSSHARMQVCSRAHDAKPREAGDRAHKPDRRRLCTCMHFKARRKSILSEFELNHLCYDKEGISGYQPELNDDTTM